MKKAIIFGLGIGFVTSANKLKHEYDIVALSDNNSAVRNHFSVIESIPVIEPEALKTLAFDCVVITNMEPDAILSIKNQLISMGIPSSKLKLYHDLLTKIDNHITLKNKKILEIGCGNGDLLKRIAANYDINEIIGIDPGLSDWWGTTESKGVNWAVRDGDAMALEFDDETFDAVISFFTFEHIPDVKKSLKEIKRVLRSGGRFFTEFMPIWTSAAGHHFSRPRDDGYYWNKEIMKLIPPWGHLYMHEDELREYLKNQTYSDTDSELINDMLSFIYHGNIINQFSRTELVTAIMNSGMLVRNYCEYESFGRFAALGVDSPEITDDITKKVVAAGYSKNDMRIHGIMCCLEKYSVL